MRLVERPYDYDWVHTDPRVDDLWQQIAPMPRRPASSGAASGAEQRHAGRGGDARVPVRDAGMGGGRGRRRPDARAGARRGGRGIHRRLPRAAPARPDLDPATYLQAECCSDGAACGPGDEPAPGGELVPVLVLGSPAGRSCGFTGPPTAEAAAALVDAAIGAAEANGCRAVLAPWCVERGSGALLRSRPAGPAQRQAAARHRPARVVRGLAAGLPGRFACGGRGRRGRPGPPGTGWRGRRTSGPPTGPRPASWRPSWPPARH